MDIQTLAIITLLGSFAVMIFLRFPIAYAVALITLFVISDDPVYIIQQFVLGPFSSPRRIGSIINLAIPFTFTGLCMCFMYAVNKFNLSGEGIFMISGCVISMVALKIGESLPGPVGILVLFVVGAAVGAFISSIPAVMEAKFNANIVVASLMLNNILVFLAIYYLHFFLLCY